MCKVSECVFPRFLLMLLFNSSEKTNNIRHVWAAKYLESWIMWKKICNFEAATQINCILFLLTPAGNIWVSFITEREVTLTRSSRGAVGRLITSLYCERNATSAVGRVTKLGDEDRRSRDVHQPLTCLNLRLSGGRMGIGRADRLSC